MIKLLDEIRKACGEPLLDYYKLKYKNHVTEEEKIKIQAKAELAKTIMSHLKQYYEGKAVV